MSKFRRNNNIVKHQIIQETLKEMKTINYLFTMEISVELDTKAHRKAIELQNEVNSGRFGREMMEGSVTGYKSLTVKMNEVQELRDKAKAYRDKTGEYLGKYETHPHKK